MRKTFTYCDICGVEQTGVHLHELAEFLITTYCEFQNPMSAHASGYQTNTFRSTEVCQPCQRILAETVSTKISELKGVNHV